MSCNGATAGELDLFDDSVFDDHDELMSLLRSDVSLDPSVAAKMNADLLSEVLSDEPGDDEVFIATDGDAHDWANAERSPRWHRSFVDLEKSRLAVQNDLRA